MNVSIYNLKCIKHTLTTSGGLNLTEYISWNQFHKTFISERWKGERRTNEESTIFGYAHTKTTVKEGNNRATHLFLFPNTLQEAEQIHAENGGFKMTNSEKLILTFMGYDDFSNPTYKTETGTLLKDLNDNIELPHLHTVSGNDIDGEPITAICNIEKYKNRSIIILGRENEPTKDEKFQYMMLSRLKQDCDYYLGNGNRSTKYLWAGSEKDQIQEMKDRYNTFSDDKKPEWLTWDDILKCENLMCNVSEQGKEGL